MQIERIKISGFRSFGSKPVRVDLAGDLTCFIGPNASGKTALLQALTKMFGVTRAQRTVAKSDFHLPPDVDPNDLSARSLYIDILINFPELADCKASAKTVAPCFKHMCIERPKQPPACRLRLEAAWEDDGTVGGVVSQEMYWINTLDVKIKDEQRGAHQDCHALRAVEVSGRQHNQKNLGLHLAEDMALNEKARLQRIMP